MTKPKATSLHQVIEALKLAFDKLPTELSTEWFSPELFQCRSSRPMDYLEEIERNAQTLTRLNQNSEQASWLSTQLESQLSAITQALLRSKHKFNSYTQPSLHVRTENARLQLEQELAKHHDYERRLTENLRLAQQQPDSAQSKQHIIQCQQRLLRCQRAIAGIERKIDALQE